MGFHTKHRETRDLDLFFHQQLTLGLTVPDATQLLVDAGYTVRPLRSSATFAQLEVRDGPESIVVDLVADPTPIAEPASPVILDTATILVETPHQLLVNKLCALLSRSELRDLVDVRALLDAGGDLTRALADCPRQDGGFSPLTFSWAVKNIAVEKLARALGWDDSEIVSIVRYRDELVDQVLAIAQP